MTEQLLALIPVYGFWLLLGVTFLSCLALPIPASIVMLTAGGLSASGDLGLWQAASGALIGAILGDQTGFAIGRSGGTALIGRLRANPSRAPLIDRATGLLQTRGVSGVFLSRWLFSPLGPWLNFASGAAAMSWPHFTLAGISGEIVWVALYVGLGFAFADSIAALGQIGGALSGVLAAGVLTIGLGYLLRRAMHDRLA